jgi:hypothetical protein
LRHRVSTAKKYVTLANLSGLLHSLTECGEGRTSSTSKDEQASPKAMEAATGIRRPAASADTLDQDADTTAAGTLNDGCRATCA